MSSFIATFFCVQCLLLTRSRRQVRHDGTVRYAGWRNDRPLRSFGRRDFVIQAACVGHCAISVWWQTFVRTLRVRLRTLCEFLSIRFTGIHWKCLWRT